MNACCFVLLHSLLLVRLIIDLPSKLLDVLAQGQPHLTHTKFLYRCSICKILTLINAKVERPQRQPSSRNLKALISSLQEYILLAVHLKEK